MNSPVLKIPLRLSLKCAIFPESREGGEKVIALVQRVRYGAVEVEGERVAEIGKGFVVLVGVCKDDEPADLVKLARKVASLRVFEDDDGKMNLSVRDIGGQVLAVSQFTLCADTTRGNRPSFDNAMEPQKAQEMFEAFVEMLKSHGLPVQKGVFGAHMLVKIENDGPVTIYLDSKAKRSR